MTDLFKQINLLYVEDDNNIRPLLERMLKRKVNELYVACDGQEGYDLYLKHKPDLILTDIKMPIMDGITFCKNIYHTNKEQKIIVLSACAKVPTLRSRVAQISSCLKMAK